MAFFIVFIVSNTREVFRYFVAVTLSKRLRIGFFLIRPKLLLFIFTRFNRIKVVSLALRLFNAKVLYIILNSIVKNNYSFAGL